MSEVRKGEFVKETQERLFEGRGRTQLGRSLSSVEVERGRDEVEDDRRKRKLEPVRAPPLTGQLAQTRPEQTEKKYI